MNLTPAQQKAVIEYMPLMILECQGIAQSLGHVPSRQERIDISRKVADSYREALGIEEPLDKVV